MPRGTTAKPRWMRRRQEGTRMSEPYCYKQAPNHESITLNLRRPPALASDEETA